MTFLLPPTNKPLLDIAKNKPNHYPLIDYDKTNKKLQQDYLDGLRKQEELLEEIADAYETIKTLKKTNKENM